MFTIKPIAHGEDQRSGSILDRVAATLQEADEIGGVANVVEYVALMDAVIAEATRRRDNAKALLEDRAVGLVEQANEVGASSSRVGAPVLTEASSREDVIAWLQWCDPNGSHTDDNARSQGSDPYTTAEAWEALSDMLLDSASEVP